jgi:hypothetical protein
MQAPAGSGICGMGSRYNAWIKNALPVEPQNCLFYYGFLRLIILIPQPIPVYGHVLVMWVSVPMIPN